MTSLVASGLHKRFGITVAVHEFSLSAERGEFISLLGPSGCGKTTVLRMIAGFETPNVGRIEIDGEDVTDMPTRLRRVGMVFQSYALFPNLTVEGNIAFGLRVSGMGKRDITRRVDEMLELIGLPTLRRRYPAELSGGQQQRVALARAVAIRPRILLLDEPLSALDAQIRVSLREDLRDLQRQLGITALFVTHDQEEALALSHRVVVMSHGRVEQIGTPAEVYRAPATEFVTSFVGTANLLNAVVLDPVAGTVRFGDVTLTTGRPLPEGRVRLAIRPEALAPTRYEDANNSFTAAVRDVTFLGAIVRLRLTGPAGTKLTVDLHGDATRMLPAEGDMLTLWFRTESLQILPN